MVLWRVRDFHDDDLDAAIRLWGDPAAGGEAPVFGLSDLVTAVRAGEPAVVAVGVHRIDCLLATGDEVGALALEHGGYRARPGMVFYEKLEPVGPEDAGRYLGRA